MRPAENPPRLVEHPTLGRDWRIAAGEDVAPERLAACGQGIGETIASLQAAPTAVGAGTSTGIVIATVTKIGLPAVIVGGLVTSYALLRTPAVPPAVSQVQLQQEQQVALEDRVEPLPQKLEAVEVPHSQRRPKPGILRAPVSAPPRAPSLLPAQLELFAEARLAAEREDFDAALGLLAEIDERYPDSPLDPEVRLARADYLVRAGRYAQATEELQKLLLEPALGGKRASILQLLGDAWMKRGRCDRATAAYDKALAAGLSDDAAAVARAAIEKCGVR